MYSESGALYKQADQIVEKWSKRITNFIPKIILITFIFPKAMQSYFVYFTTDLGAKAFELPIPVW